MSAWGVKVGVEWDGVAGMGKRCGGRGEKGARSVLDSHFVVIGPAVVIDGRCLNRRIADGLQGWVCGSGWDGEKRGKGTEVGARICV